MGQIETPIEKQILNVFLRIKLIYTYRLFGILKKYCLMFGIE